MQTDLLIIGAGPIGLLAAALAVKHNLRVDLIEQQEAPIQCHSHAHYLNAYSIEILVSAGIPYETLSALAVDAERARKMVVCHQLNHTIGRVDLNQDKDYCRRFSEAGRFGAHLNIPAAKLHQCLLKLVQQLSIQFRDAHRPVRIDVDKKMISIENKQTQERYDCYPRYVLACDGANGVTADLAGIPLVNKRSLMSFLTVACRGSLRNIVEDEAMIYWIYHESMVACMVAFDLDQSQILQIPLVGYQTQSQFTEDQLRHDFAAICGVSEKDLAFSFQIYNRWQLQTGLRSTAHKNNWLFILGDALHQILPAGGLGLNTGLADAYNLIWKLATMQSSPIVNHRFIETYEAERMPSASSAVNQSIENYQSFMRMAQTVTLGASKYHGLVSGKTPVAWLGKQWLSFCQYIHESSDYASENLQACLQEVRSHYDGTAMHYQVYYDSALVLNPSSRRYYELDVVEAKPRVGMRLLNKAYCIKGVQQFIYDLIDGRAWTLLCIRESQDSKQIQASMQTLPLNIITLDNANEACTQMAKIDALLIRPDLFIYAIIGEGDTSWGECSHALAELVRTARD